MPQPDALNHTPSTTHPDPHTMNQTMPPPINADPETSKPDSQQPARPESIAVEIYDQIYHLRGIDPAYIERLAALVDAKMRAVSASGSTVDSLRVAVLASLNIADELVTLRQRYEALAGSLQQSQNAMRSRSASLSATLDEVLDDHATRRAG